MTKSIMAFQTSETLPAHIMAGTTLGNENVSADDMAVPQLGLIQSLSPELKKSDSKYIKGAEVGHIFNKVTGETFENIFVVNLKYESIFTIFRKREKGGGFEGNYETQASAEQHMADEGLSPDEHQIVDTAIHTVACLDENGRHNQIARIYMSNSNKKVSDAWNTAIANMQTDRFAKVWVLSSAEETNRRGQAYQVFKTTDGGFADEALYNESRSAYFAMKGMADPTIH